MFHGRKGAKTTARWILLAITALALTGAGLVLVPGAGADKFGNGNGCGAISSGGNNVKGSKNNGGGDKGNGNGGTDACDTNTGTTGPGGHDGNGGGNGCKDDSHAVVRSDETSGDSTDCDGKGEDNDGDSDDACVETAQHDCDEVGGVDNDNDGDDTGTIGPTGPTGPAGPAGTTSGVNTTASSGASGVQGVKSTSSSKKKSIACTSRRRFVIRIRYPHGQYLVSAAVNVNGKRVQTMHGKRISSTITLIGLPRGTVKVHIRAVTNKGKVLHGVRTYHTCVPHRGHTIPKL